jgi:hypothetical protein
MCSAVKGKRISDTKKESIILYENDTASDPNTGAIENNPKILARIIKKVWKLYRKYPIIMAYILSIIKNIFRV